MGYTWKGWTGRIGVLTLSGLLAVAAGCVSFGTTTDPEVLRRQQNHFERGLLEYNRERYEEAIAQWKQAHNLAPGTDTGKKAKAKIEEAERVLKTLQEYGKLHGQPKKS